MVWVIVGCTCYSCKYDQFLYTEHHSESYQLTQKPYKHILAPGDKISISIWGHEDMEIGSVFGATNANESYGKWIMLDHNGQVKLPALGAVQLGGLSIEEALEKLENVYGHIIEFPNITLKVVNLEITVLGEVNAPGRYVIDRENISLLKVLGIAGGFTQYAKLDNITIVRGDPKNPEALKVNLTRLDEMTKSNIMVRPNDVIYIEPKKVKGASLQAQVLTPVLALISTIAILISVMNN